MSHRVSARFEKPVVCELEFKRLLAADTNHGSAFSNDNRPSERICSPRYRKFHCGEGR